MYLTDGTSLTVQTTFAQAYRSCLESSAQGGVGYGIDIFKPQRGPLQISSNLKIPNIARVLRKDQDKSSDYVTPVPRGQGGSDWRRWTVQEMNEAQLAGELKDQQMSMPWQRN